MVVSTPSSEPALRVLRRDDVLAAAVDVDPVARVEATLLLHARGATSGLTRTSRTRARCRFPPPPDGRLLAPRGRAAARRSSRVLSGLETEFGQSRVIGRPWASK